MTDQIENVARAIDPVAWKWIDATRLTNPEHMALPLTIGRLMGQARAAIKAANQWLPIESAPKDGTEILAYSEHGGTDVMLVRHIAMIDFLTDSEIEAYVEDGATASMLEDADWFYADFLHGDRLSPDCYPTHWKPLPALPAEDGGGA